MRASRSSAAALAEVAEVPVAVALAVALRMRMAAKALHFRVREEAVEAVEADDGWFGQRRIHPQGSRCRQHLGPRARARIVNTTSSCPHSLHPYRRAHATPPELSAECR